jgi:hypothetical protein
MCADGPGGPHRLLTSGSTLLPDAMKKIEKQFNKAAIIELYNTVDLIGIRSYAENEPLVWQQVLMNKLWTAE